MWWEAIAIEAAENEWYELEVLVIAVRSWPKELMH